MTRDDASDLALFGGLLALAGGVAWLVWPKDDVAASRAYAPAPTPQESTVRNTPMPAFLAAAPAAGPARERYFEAAVDAPTWVDVPVGQGIVLRVSSDYVQAQGIRVPLWPSTAQRVADRFGAMLPTKRLVDAIWRAATVKVSPHPMTPGPNQHIDDNRILAAHEAIVDAQVANRPGLRDGMLKSIVVGRSIATPSGRLAVWIYGWHRPDGTAVQPVFGGHSKTYGADYSHGTRLISRTAYLNGQPVAIESLFANPQYAPLLNESGVLTPEMLRYPTA